MTPASNVAAKPTVTRAARVKSLSPGRPVHRPASGRAPSSPAGSMNRSDLGPLVSVSVPPATLARQAGDPDGSNGNGTPGRRKSVTVAVSHVMGASVRRLALVGER